MSHSEKTAQEVRLEISSLYESAPVNSVKDFYILSDRLFPSFRVPAPSGPMIFDGFAIVLFQTGGNELYINGRSYHVEDNSVLLLPPNMIIEYDYRNVGQSRRRLFVSFEMLMELPSPLDTDIISGARRMPLVRVSSEEFRKIDKWFSSIEDEYSKPDNVYREEILKALLYIMILDIGNIYSRLDNKFVPSTSLAAERVSDEFFRLMSLHYKKDRTVKFYASLMALTPKHLSRSIRQITGRTPHEWLDDAVLLEIKNQLRLTDKTILQISEDLNFCSPSAFVHFFRIHTGITPYCYRRT